MQTVPADLQDSFIFDAWDALSSFEGATARLHTFEPEIVKELSVVAHRLKGTAALYRYPQISSLAELAEYAGCDRATVEEGIIELLDDYAHRDSALEVVETPNGYSLQLRAGFQELVQTLIPVELGVGALRTLAAIALHNPITQTNLVNLRGSGAYQHVQELVELGFVRKRRQADCRSSWLHITDKFHQYFQLEQLPQPFFKESVPEERSQGLGLE